MTTVSLLNVLVRKDASNIIPVSVPDHECIILKQLFGNENVNEYKEADAIELDPSVEYDRLVSKYGEEVVKDIYRSAPALTAIVMDAAQKPQKKAKKETSTEEV